MISANLGAYPEEECLRILAAFAMYRLDEFGYDGHGWEVLSSAALSAQEHLKLKGYPIDDINYPAAKWRGHE